MGGVVLAAVLGYGLDPNNNFARRLAGGASAVTILGAVLAIAIFAWSRWVTDATADQLGELGKQVGSIEDKILTPALLEGDDADVEDVEPAPAKLDRRQVIWEGVALEFVEGEDVPLRVLADLVNRWRADGSTGRWTVGDLEWAARKSGRGNHPWILKFEGRDYVYRVAYGGKGKREHGTVTRHPVPDL